MAVMIIVVDGVEYAAGTPDVDTIEGELLDPSEIDPEGWRVFSDVMTPETVEYLKTHPRPSED